MLEPFAATLATKASLTLGTDLFLVDYPNSAPDKCVMVTETPGTFDPDTPNQQVHGIQILVRDWESMDARDWAQAIFDVIVEKYNEAFIIEGWTIGGVRGRTPQPIGQDGLDRFVYSLNFTYNVRKDT